MAAYSGGQIAAILMDDTLVFCSSTIVNKTPKVITVLGIDDVTNVVKGPLTYNEATMLEFNYDGYRARTFLDEYYYRIHIVPNDFNLGPILADMERDFIVWNAHFDKKTCSVINAEGASGLTLLGLIAPFTLNGLQHTDYIIQIPLDGVPVLQTTYTFDFGVGEEFPVTIEGTRVTLFIFRPQETVNESLEWFTNILSPRYGIAKEQRIALRKIPRQGFRFSVLLPDEQLQSRMDSILFNGQRRLWGLPIWTEMCLHTTDITAGMASIMVSTDYADFRSNSLAIIWQSPTICEVVEISSFTSSTLTLNSPVIGNYYGNKLIIPLRLAKMNGVVQRRNFAPGPAAFDFTFMIQDNAAITGFTAVQVYKSLPVLVNATPVENTQDKTSDAEPNLVDFNTGDFEILMDSVHNRFGQAFLFYNDTKQDCWKFRQFLHSLYGRQSCVWIPTFKNDMILRATIAPTDTNFRVNNCHFTKGMGLNILRTNVAFIFLNGTIICKEITGIAETDDVEEIFSIDSGIGITVNPGDCVISFLDKCRLSADQVQLAWPMAHQNECTLNFTVVKE